MTHLGAVPGAHQRRPARHRAVDATGAVVLAAGDGLRLGRGVKSLVPVAGTPILAWALAAVAANRCVRHIVVTAPPGATTPIQNLVAGLRLRVPVSVITGGATRQHSARRGVDALPAGLAWAAITEAARPLQAPGLVDTLVAQLTDGLAEQGDDAIAGIVPALPLSDTIHHVTGDGIVAGTPERAALRAAQTPQVACRTCLSAAYRAAERAGVALTDDAAVMVWAGARILLAPGDPTNIKITVPADLIIAEVYAAQHQQNNRKAVSPP